jgi:hypothetical protein
LIPKRFQQRFFFLLLLSPTFCNVRYSSCSLHKKPLCIKTDCTDECYVSAPYTGWFSMSETVWPIALENVRDHFIFSFLMMSRSSIKCLVKGLLWLWFRFPFFSPFSHYMCVIFQSIRESTLIVTWWLITLRYFSFSPLFWFPHVWLYEQYVM